jgi:hypothetical protein
MVYRITGVRGRLHSYQKSGALTLFSRVGSPSAQKLVTARSTYLILDCGTENLQQVVPQNVIKRIWVMRAMCATLKCVWNDEVSE